MTAPEKKLSKSNNWKTFKGKLKNYGYSLMLISALGLTWCWSSDLDVKKAAEKYQDAIGNVDKAKDNVKSKEEALKDAQKDLIDAQKTFIDAEKDAQEAKKDLKGESNKL